MDKLKDVKERVWKITHHSSLRTESEVFGTKFQNSQKKFYITTAIDYTNGRPHVGHVLEKVQADAVARYHRLASRQVFFLTGTDEHGTKIYRTAKEAGKDPQQFCDELATFFINIKEVVNLSWNDFIRTTDKTKHWPGAQKLWTACQKDIEKRKYKGLYCVGCEAFFTEKDLVNGECPIHKKKPELIEEENYFFLLSRYQKQLRELISGDIYRIVPKSRKKEILNFIDEGLQDVSISRPRRVLPWGIPVPGDEEHVFYVWFDALSNYITGAGFGRDENLFRSLWPADVHVIGKDILRFHALIWPAMLLSAGIQLPKTLFAHGYITLEGQKISKSLGNVVYAEDYVEKYGIDALRYYLLAEISPTEDGDFTQERFVSTYNAALANDLGNLVMRAATLAVKAGGKTKKGDYLSDELKEVAGETTTAYKKHFEAFEFDKAAAAVWKLIRATNKYVNDTAPWTLSKEKRDKELEGCIYSIVEALRITTVLLKPLIPGTAEKMRGQFGFADENFSSLGWGGAHGLVKEAPALFPKIEEKQKDPIEAFDFRVAKILSVSEHPNAEKLYVLQIDLGDEKRQLVAGLRSHYTKEDLKDKKIVIIANLEPAVLRGVESQGMLLAAEDKNGKVGVLTVEALPGEKIFFTKGTPSQKVTIKEFQKVSLVASQESVLYDNKPLKTESGAVVRAERVEQGAKVR